MLAKPQTCIFCYRWLWRDMALCQHCQAQLPYTTKALNRLSIFRYQSPIKELITQGKYQKQLLKLDILGLLAAQDIKQYYKNTKPEVIIPIPLHKVKHQQRGFNQTQLLAQRIAQALNISIDTNTLVRRRNTHSQSQLNYEQRQKNVRNAFILSKENHYRHILLIDDVITTGATMQQAKQTLFKSTSCAIDCWSIATNHKGE